ncbi:MAG: hemin uptake protein HemP [Burkholderiales bacterium]|nr:hemin uptake protein HemP [Burkholderiales bacterium]
MASLPTPGIPGASGAPPGPEAGAAPASSVSDRDADPRASHRRVPSRDLFRGATEVEIVHHEHVYRLRQTALGKLILTK